MLDSQQNPLINGKFAVERCICMHSSLSSVVYLNQSECAVKKAHLLTRENMWSVLGVAIYSSSPMFLCTSRYKSTSSALLVLLAAAYRNWTRCYYQQAYYFVAVLSVSDVVLRCTIRTVIKRAEALLAVRFGQLYFSPGEYGCVEMVCTILSPLVHVLLLLRI